MEEMRMKKTILTLRHCEARSASVPANTLKAMFLATALATAALAPPAMVNAQDVGTVSAEDQIPDPASNINKLVIFEYENVTSGVKLVNEKGGNDSFDKIEFMIYSDGSLFWGMFTLSM
jgi:hypothetical protein